MTSEVFSSLCDPMTLPLPGMSLDALHASVCPWARLPRGSVVTLSTFLTLPHPHLLSLQFPVGHKAPSLPTCVCPCCRARTSPACPYLVQALCCRCLYWDLCVPCTGDKPKCWGSTPAALAWAAVLPPHRPIPAWTGAVHLPAPPSLRAGCCSHSRSGLLTEPLFR